MPAAKAKPKRKRVTKKTSADKMAAHVASKNEVKRSYVQAPRTVDPGIKCPHCGERYGHRITNTYGNGNRRRICGGCGLPWVSIRVSVRYEEMIY